MIPKATVDKILDTAQIEDVVGEFVPLKRAGANFKANSPWTDERTPSFFVAPGKNIFKDFSSGKGGNPVTFLMEHEHLSYPQALRWLAEFYKIEIPEQEESAEEKEQRTEREAIQILLNYAARYYHEYLLNEEDGKAVGLAYFKERGFTETVIDKFQLGYAPDEKRHFTDHALNQQYKEDYLERAGLGKKTNDGGIIDQFRDRVIFPIHSVSGKTLGFGGRILKSNTKLPKYINSPETEIYDKSKVLYGIYQAKDALRKKDEAILVEGYTDVIALHEAGVENVVASSGTSLTDDQMKLIKRFTNQLIFMFDGDQAGTDASMRGVDMALQHDLSVKVLHLPEEHDPDSFAQDHSAEEIREYIDNHVRDFLMFKIEQSKDAAQQDPIKRAETIRGIVKSIAQIPDNLNRNLYIKEAARILQVEEELLYQELNRHLMDKAKREDKKAAREEQSAREEDLTGPGSEAKGTWGQSLVQEKQVVETLLRYGPEDFSEEESVAMHILGDVKDLEWESPSCHSIIQLYQDYLTENQDHPPESLFTQHEDRSVQQMAVDAYTQQFQISENWKAKIGKVIKPPDENYTVEVTSGLNHLKLKKLLQMLQQNEEELRKAASDEKVQELLQVHNHLNVLKQKITDQLGTVILEK